MRYVFRNPKDCFNYPYEFEYYFLFALIFLYNVRMVELRQDSYMKHMLFLFL